MYPNQAPQQNLGFYIPPPMNFTGVNQQKTQFNQNGDMGDLLNDMMRSRPNFGGDVFGGPVYQSKFLWSGFMAYINSLLIYMGIKTYLYIYNRQLKIVKSYNTY